LKLEHAFTQNTPIFTIVQKTEKMAIICTSKGQNRLTITKFKEKETSWTP